MNGFTQFIQRFGVMRLIAVLGASAGVAAVLGAVLMHVGGEPQSLLYSDLDLREAGQITQALDQANIPYESRGDGSSIMVPRDRVGSARMMLAGRGLPTQSSVGYELFDNASTLGQTDFTQNLNRQRATQGELERTLRSIQGVTSARVMLVMPRRQLFEDQAEQPSASVVIGTSRGDLPGEQVRAVRNLIAGAVPGLTPQRVNVVDTRGRLLAGGDNDASGASGEEQRQSTEAALRARVTQLVEGIVGPGNARVDVTADIDMNQVTIDQRTFDPDGQVVRSTSSGEENSSETTTDSSGATSASTNVPGGAQQAPTIPTSPRSTSGNRQEVTNYEIGTTHRTEVQQPGRIRRLSVAVAVNGTFGPPQNGRPGAYTARSAEEIQRIDQLVKAAVGYVNNAERQDVVQVTPVRFDREAVPEGGEGGLMSGLDKNDLMRGVELFVLVLVSGLIIFFVARPLLKAATAAPGVTGLSLALAGPPGEGGAQLAGPAAQAMIGMDGAGAAQLPGPNSEFEQRIDLARVEGQVKVSSVKKVADFVERHPDESVAILRGWMQEA